MDSMSAMNALEQYINATNTHDFKHVKQLLHPKAIYWFSDKTCTTLDEIQHYFEKAWDTIKEEKYSASNIQWLVVEEKYGNVHLSLSLRRIFLMGNL